jgi:hypothetical protein
MNVQNLMPRNEHSERVRRKGICYMGKSANMYNDTPRLKNG